MFISLSSIGKVGMWSASICPERKSFLDTDGMLILSRENLVVPSSEVLILPKKKVDSAIDFSATDLSEEAHGLLLILSRRIVKTWLSSDPVLLDASIVFKNVSIISSSSPLSHSLRGPAD
jgi:hypothetical protein